jgi:hypothetical protein
MRERRRPPPPYRRVQKSGTSPDADEAAYKHAGKQPKNPDSEGSNHVTFPLSATSAGRFSGIVFQILLGYGLTMFVLDLSIGGER